VEWTDGNPVCYSKLVALREDKDANDAALESTTK
jgi:hypothetical protein